MQKSRGKSGEDLAVDPDDDTTSDPVLDSAELANVIAHAVHAQELFPLGRSCFEQEQAAARKFARLGIRLGEGGSGQVYELQGKGGKRYAIKIIHATSDGELCRFRKEAELLQSLQKCKFQQTGRSEDQVGEIVLPDGEKQRWIWGEEANRYIIRQFTSSENQKLVKSAGGFPMKGPPTINGPRTAHIVMELADC
ncbi:unnamed protein product, partial [Amoebophrya sp. A120]|eukprot:GSA120T00018064001.1